MPLDSTQAQHATLEESAGERATRQLRTCRRITELSMALAEAAAETAIQELAEPAEPKPSPPTPNTPKRAPKQPTHATHEAALQNLQDTLETLADPNQPSPNPTQSRIGAASLFHRLCRLALAAIALENSIAAHAAAEAAARPVWRSPDPRRPILTRALHLATRRHPNAATLRREMEDRLDEEMQAAPEATADIILKICRGYAIHIKENPARTDPDQDLYKVLGTWPDDTG